MPLAIEARAHSGGDRDQADSLSEVTGRVVHHFGPDSAHVGGMGSVIRILAEHHTGAGVAVAHPTWRPRSRSRNMNLALRAAVRIARLPRTDVIHVHVAEKGALIREGALVALARALRRPTVVTIHGSGFLAYARRHSAHTAHVLRRAHVITCLDPEVLALVRDAAPRARVELVPNPVVMADAHAPTNETAEIVLFAGIVGLRKGADVLSRAWEIVAGARPNARLIVAGPQGDFAMPTGERLEMRGPVAPEQVAELIRAARVVALPSRAEGMPMFLLEAMSAARPFASTPVGGIPELALHGGVLVDVGDHEALAARLIELLADPAEARRRGERAREFCRRTRSVEVLDGRFAELYADAAGRSRRAKRLTRASPKM